MMRIKEEEVGTAIEMPIGHHLIDIGLADPMLGILDRRRKALPFRIDFGFTVPLLGAQGAVVHAAFAITRPSQVSNLFDPNISGGRANACHIGSRTIRIAHDHHST